MNTIAEVYMWGTRIGIVHLEDDRGYASFQYDNDFLRNGIELSPINMPLSSRVYSFPALAKGSFHGVPGLIADSLPDAFGNAIISKWLAGLGKSDDSFNVIDRLCYTGKRGMGALEFIPATGPAGNENDPVDVAQMVEFASQILHDRENAHINMDDDITAKQLLALGTSAGGARAKAIIAWNEKTNDIRSGQVDLGGDYGYWIIKFDGVTDNGNHGIKDTPQYTLIEYAYHLMATDAGIDMKECRLLRENERVHFMTKRFDRRDGGDKIHMQSLGALGHIDYNYPGLCSYEQAGVYARRIKVPAGDIEQLYRRMVFNVLAVNQDDHVKNISFLMDRDGRWTLAPAYDVTFAYDSTNRWLSAHQMTVNGKNKNICEADLLECGKAMDISNSKCNRMIDDVRESVARWSDFAQKAGVREEDMEKIQKFIDLYG